MKIKTFAFSIFAITLITSSVALAVSESNSINAEITRGATTGTVPTANVSTATRTEVENDRADEDTQENEDRKNDDRSSMGDSHRSTVATFVHHILEVSDRERGIGAQVKVIAQMEDDSEKETTDTIVKIENRSAFKTFLLGSDYKNIGALRSNMTTTSNQLTQLKKLADKAVTTKDKVEIKAEIEAMEQEQVKIETFISAHENKFSLFGWLFNRKEK